MSNQKRLFVIYVALTAVFCIFPFLPGTHGGFLLDDEPTITDNPAVHIHDLSAASLSQAAYGFAAGGGSRALPMLSFGLNYWWAGADPVAFKATNIFIHVLTTIALASLLRLLLQTAGWSPTRTSLAAPALALAWAIHPLQVSSVLYVVQRMQIMGTLFLILALQAYLRARLAQMEQQRSRHYWMLAALCWALAMASKEDSILLPAYALILDWTLLRFRGGTANQSQKIRRSWMALTGIGLLIYVAVIIPHYWHAAPYPLRDFSTPERLLTQGRVLLMYLWQAATPIPSHLPFFYDDLVPSHGLLRPASTLISLLLLAALLALAWHLRHRRPLFSCGIFLFFSAHLITSNVIGLELAFEHRNHFALIGIVLAAGDLIALGLDKIKSHTVVSVTLCALWPALLGGLTYQRASSWGSPLNFAETSTLLAPNSERAWIQLCRVLFAESKGNPQVPAFDRAITACSTGAKLPKGASNLASLITLKSIQGTVTQADWNRLDAKLRHIVLTPSDIGIAWYLIRYSNGDARVAPRNVLRIVSTIGSRAPFRPEEYVAFGYYAAKHQLPADALQLFVKAVHTSSPASHFGEAVIADLQSEGYPNWAAQLLPIVQQHRHHTP